MSSGTGLRKSAKRIDLRLPQPHATREALFEIDRLTRCPHEKKSHCTDNREYGVRRFIGVALPSNGEEG